MVKITYHPWKEIIIHEIIKSKPEDLFSDVVRRTLQAGGAGITPTLDWAGGVSFVVSVFPSTEEVTRESLNGVLHYASVQFAIVPEYKPEVRLTHDGVTRSIKLLKLDENPLFLELASFLKQGTFKDIPDQRHQI